MTKVKVCTCTSKFQDKEYGEKQRVFNKTSKVKSTSEKSYFFRCTVCGNEK